jgi:hypothetical protein
MKSSSLTHLLRLGELAAAAEKVTDGMIRKCMRNKPGRCPFH